VADEKLLSFIQQTLKSVWALELLLLLRNNPGKTWTGESLVRELRGSDNIVKTALAELKSAHLVKEPGPNHYLFAPATAELNAMVDMVSQAYTDRPIAVIKAITGAPNEKLRVFSDAFKVRGR